MDELDLPNTHPFLAIRVMPYGHGTGITVLGNPVAHPVNRDTFLNSFWEPRLRGLSQACKTISAFPRPHIQFTLLRSCLDACRINHVLRTQHFRDGYDNLEIADSIIRNALAIVMGCICTDEQWTQATLPVGL